MTEPKTYEVRLPDTEEKSDLSSMYSDEMTNGLWSSEEKASLDLHTLKSLLSTEDWVFITVDLLATECSNIPLKVYRKQIVDGKVQYEEAPYHSAQKMIDQPNAQQDGNSFTYANMAEYFLMGNAFIWIALVAGKMFQLATEGIAPVYSADGTGLDGYRYTPNDLFRGKSENEVVLMKNDVAHMMRPTPGSMWFGLSPFIPGNKSILFNKYTKDYLNNFYLKGAQPGLVLSLDKVKNEAQTLRMLKSFENAHTGRRNQRRTMILPQGVEAKEFKSTIAEQELLDLVRDNRETILALLHVPKHAVGLQETGSLGSNEHKAALKYLWTSTIVPNINRYAKTLDNALRPVLGPDFCIRADYQDIEILKEDELNKALLAEKLLLTHSLNEVRAKLYNLEPKENGDKIGSALPPIAPVNMQLEETPTFKQAPMPGRYSVINFRAPSDVIATMKEGISLSKGNGELVETAKRIVSGGGATPTWIRQSNRTHKRQMDEVTFKLLGGEPGKQWIQTLNNQMDTLDKERSGPDLAKRLEEALGNTVTLSEKSLVSTGEKAEDFATKELREQYLEAIKVLSKNLKSMKATKPKVKEKKIRAELEKVYAGRLEDWEKEYVNIFGDAVDTGINVGISTIQSNKLQDAVDAVTARNSKGTREILAERGLFSFKNVSSTTTDDIMGKVTEHFEEGTSFADLVKSIVDMAGNLIPNRAKVIARTETLTALSIGQAATTDAADSLVPGLKKVWISARDNRVRDSHQDLDGKVVSVNEEFKDGLRYPRDPKGAANEVIQCRCAYLVVPPEDLDELLEGL